MGDRLWRVYVTSNPGKLSLVIPQWVGAMSSSLGLRDGLVWLIGAAVCLYAAPTIRLFTNVDNGWLHNVLRYH